MLSLRTQQQFIALGCLLISVGLLIFLGAYVLDVPLNRLYRFFSLTDPSVRIALLGCCLLGVNCGLLGSFLVVRRLALLGDTLSHAVLPGVAIGFIWAMEKNPWVIFVGASLAGLLSTGFITLLKKTTKIREDSVLGIVLASFYAVGVCLITRIQNMNLEGKAGVQQYLFGQAAAISEQDVLIMGGGCVVALIVVLLFYKELLILSFDVGFGGSLGLPAVFINNMLMVLVTFTIISSLQATGAILVVAMLITPAVTAQLITRRFSTMLMIAILLGVLGGLSGALFSFLGPHLPTGPLMIISVGVFFCVAFFLAPERGLLMKWYKRYQQCLRIDREDALKACYYLLEEKPCDERRVMIKDLAVKRQKPIPLLEKTLRRLRQHGFIQLMNQEGALNLTDKGWERACQIIRSHRLWELYLTHAADYQSNHVHDDAEQIEHWLGEDLVREIEQRLDFPETDPHGSKIPHAKKS